MDDINARIKREICYKTLDELTDAKLMCEYILCNSVKNEIKNLEMYWKNIRTRKQKGT